MNYESLSHAALVEQCNIKDMAIKSLELRLTDTNIALDAMSTDVDNYKNLLDTAYAKLKELETPKNELANKPL